MSRHRTRRCHDDTGSAGVETALAVIALLSMTFFVVGGLRITNTNGDVSAAARAGARAAAAAGSTSAASANAAAVVDAMLASRGVACVGGPSTSVSGAGSADSLVRVTVTCTVSLDDVVLGGFPGSRSVTSSAIEYTDSVRGF